MNYPISPLGETFRKFVDFYLGKGGRPDSFRGLNQTNLWEVLARVAAHNSEELLGHNLSRADGGIEAVPESLGWFEAYKAGETNFRFLSSYDAELRYNKTHRSATLAEALLFAAVTPKEKMGDFSYVALTRENLGVAPNGKPYMVFVCHSVNTIVRLVPRGDLSPSHRFLVVPRKPGRALAVP